MNPNRINQRRRNRLLPLLVILVVFLVSGLCFDFYYDLNDDVLIKDILSGAFLGYPDGHTNQLLYPLGWVISLGYRIFPGLPVYGLFLLGMYGLCFYLIGYRSIQEYEKLRGKLLILLVEAGVFLSLFLWELVYVQYSVVCGLLSAAACYWFYTTKRGLGPKAFWLSNLPVLVLLWLAFLLRSEMLLLTTPYIAAVGLFHWYDEVAGSEEIYRKAEKIRLTKRIWTRTNCLKYLLFPAAAALGCGILLVLDYAAYSDSGWKEYRQFFDARTLLYDYTWYPDYEENQEFYESIGVSQEQFWLVDSYNFGLDPSIDANTLEDIASFGEKAKHQGDMGERIKNALWNMGSRMLSPQDGPYNYFVLVACGLVVALAILQRDRSYLVKLALLAMVRTIPWMYLLLADRTVDRIAHPLYILEFLVVMALLVKELHDRPLWNVEKIFRWVAVVTLGAAVFAGAVPAFSEVAAEQDKREEVNEPMEAFRDYAGGQPLSYYYLDVYSSVYFTEKMFDQETNARKNYDILGGWFCHSPLQKGVLKEYAKQEALTQAEALLQDNFYLVLQREQDMSPIMAWYEGAKTPVEVQEVAALGQGDKALLVYRLIPVE